jgi:hypothetical protein
MDLQHQAAAWSCSAARMEHGLSAGDVHFLLVWQLLPSKPATSGTRGIHTETSYGLDQPAVNSRARRKKFRT